MYAIDGHTKLQLKNQSDVCTSLQGVSTDSDIGYAGPVDDDDIRITEFYCGSFCRPMYTITESKDTKDYKILERELEGKKFTIANENYEHNRYDSTVLLKFDLCFNLVLIV